MSECTNEKWWKVSKEEEYKQNKNIKESDVNIIQEWLKKQPHLPSLNDNQIIMFLTACDFSLEQTKLSIDLNYTMRTKLPEIFAQKDLRKKSMDIVLEYLQLATLSPIEGDNILILCKVNEVDFAKFNADDATKLFFMFHDMTHLEYGSRSSSGYTYIVDMKNISLSLLLHTPISTIGNMLKYWKDCSTYKIKEFHILNGGHILKKVLQIVQQFLGSEVMELVQMHDNEESLKQKVDANLLPKEYGGNAGSFDELSKKTMKIFKQYNDWFIAEEKQRIDEKKRVSKKSIDEGLQGSFRKLNFD